MHDSSPAPVDLPAIPGNWERRCVEIGSRSVQLYLPQQPDLFLDDPDVLAANARNDYMPYWAYLWPAAAPMARALEWSPWPAGTRVLELGAGIGLVGLSAMLRGDEVVFSDYDSKSLQLCQVNARLNGLITPRTLLMDWRSPESDTTFPVILGCEVTYDAQQHAALLDVIDRLLEPQGICWLGDPGRYQAPLFYERAIHKGYHVCIKDDTGRVHHRPRENSFQIFELRK